MTLMMTSAQVVETSVNVTSNSPSGGTTLTRTITIYRIIIIIITIIIITFIYTQLKFIR